MATLKKDLNRNYKNKEIHIFKLLLWFLKKYDSNLLWKN